MLFIFFLAIIYSNPAFTVIFAAFYLGERFRRVEGVYVTLCLIGAIFITKPEFMFGDTTMDNPDNKDGATTKTEHGFAVMVTVACVILVASDACIIRNIGDSAHFVLYVIHMGVVGSTMSIFALLCRTESFVWPQALSDDVMFIMMGVFAFVAICPSSKG